MGRGAAYGATVREWARSFGRSRSRVRTLRRSCSISSRTIPISAQRPGWRETGRGYRGNLIVTETPTILVTGAAGNLGSRLARHLAQRGSRLRLMVHRSPLPADLTRHASVTAVPADLAGPATLPAAVSGVSVVVHFAGVLFAPGPERFLPVTNTRWFANLLDACLAARVGKVILISFPHVEGPTSVDAPATGRTDREPVSVHARTRLEEERLLLERP